jgi:non-reducing end alpha-L-arabinofuranosidase
MQLEMSQMKKTRALVVLSFTAAIGAAIASCMSFSSGSDNGNKGTGGSDNGGMGGMTGGGTGGTPDTGAGGMTDTGVGGSTQGTGGSAQGMGGSNRPDGGNNPGVGGATTGVGGMVAGTGGSGTPPGPCDVLAAAGNNCVAAHSTTRVLAQKYTGPLYQVCKGASAPGPNSCPGNVTMDIPAVNGYVNAMVQDTFCAGATCTISIIYDQSGMANHLHPAPAGGAKASPDNPGNATDLLTSINGHKAYGLFVKPGVGYRAGCTGCAVVTPKGTATGDTPETQYMVTSQNGLVDSCCFDYGNAETDSRDDNNGTMEAVYFGGGVVWGTGTPGGHNNGPWVMADLENGLYAGWENNQDQNISTNTPIKLPFITGVLVGDACTGVTGCGTSPTAKAGGRFALYGGDATTGALKVMYDGIRPQKAGYVPMKKQGSIILGIGGDNSDSGGGQWFEGVMATGAATIQTVNALQANIVAARYGK